MLHLAYFGIGLLCLFLVAVFPAIISYMFDVFVWWWGGKRDEAPRLTNEYGSYWCGGAVIIAGLGVAYAIGFGVWRLLHH